MSIFSNIGNALKKVVGGIAPIVGSIFGGPVGGVVGSAVSGLVGGVKKVGGAVLEGAGKGVGSLLSGAGNAVGSALTSNVGPLIGGAAQYFSAKDVNEANAAMLEQQNRYNVTNAATANAFTRGMAGEANAFTAGQADRANVFSERMFDRSVATNREFMQKQHDENRFLSNQSIAENRASMDRAMQFEREMSGTAYQRATADMRAAGINPMVAYAQGGASTPNAPALSAPTGGAGGSSVSGGHGAFGHGAFGHGTAAHASSPIPSVQKWGPAVASALQLQKLASEVRILEGDARIRTREAQDVERFGSSGLGRTIGTGVRTAGTAWDAVVSFMNKLRGVPQESNTGPVTRPHIGVEFLGGRGK